MTDAIRIAAIYRYPVKGLSPERLARTDLVPGEVIVNDRRYAIENGPSGFDAAAPVHAPKVRYLMLMRNERLARLRTSFDDATTTLTIVENGREAVKGDLLTGEGRLAVEAFFRRFMPGQLRGAPKVLHAPGHSFSDVPRKVVSLINLASVGDLQRVAGAPVDPLRFRGNLHVAGLAPWAEFDLVGQILQAPSGARLKVFSRIQRCAATEVDPATGTRDLGVPKLLMTHYGHVDCGIYAEVIAPGRIAEADRLTLAA